MNNYEYKRKYFIGWQLYLRVLFCCSRLLSKIFEDGHPPKRSVTSLYRRTARPGSWATRLATMLSITSYPAPRNRFRLSRSSKRFISIRYLIADRTGIIEIAARNTKTDRDRKIFSLLRMWFMNDNLDKASKIYFQHMSLDFRSLAI